MMKLKQFMFALVAMLVGFAMSSSAQTSVVSTLDELKEALANSTNIVVNGDVAVDEAITIPSGTTVGGDGTLHVQTKVYVVSTETPYPGVTYNKTATKNGAISGTVSCGVVYEISLDGGETWFTDTTNGKAQAVTVKTDGTKSISTSFQSAFTSAKCGEVVHMLKDAHVQSTNSKKNNGPLRSYYGLILEGNGHTIYTDLESSGASNEYATIKFTSYLAGTGADVRPVLKNVTINSQNNAKADLDLVSGDVTFTVSLYNVNLLGYCQYASWPVKSSSAIINKSNVKLYDSKIPSWDAGSANAIEFYSGQYSLKFNSKCKVYGGTFTNNPSNYLASCAQVKQENGKYVVSYKKAEVKVEVTPSEEFTSSATEEEKAVADELASNTAVSNETLTLPVGVSNFTVQLTDIETTAEAATKVTFNVEPKDASGAKVSNPSEAITFRLPVPAAWSGNANVYHGSDLLGAYTIKEESGAKYVEVSSSSFSEFSVEAIVPTEVEVATLAELQAALADNSNELPIIITETIVIPEGETVVLDLNGKTVTRQDEATKYAINNLGTLTIQDTKGNGSINARGMYNGYGNGGENVASATMTILGGTFNAKGTNGGAAIFNYGTANVNGGTFTSIGGYSLNNQAGSTMTIAAGVSANNGVYNSNATLTIDGGEISGNRSGCHVIYAWNSTLTINGGEFYNNNSGNATIMSAGTSVVTINGGTFGIKDGRVPGNSNTWTSCLTDVANTAQIIVNGGTLNGGFRVQAGTSMTINGGSFNDVYGSNYNIYGTVTVTGGTFTDDTAKAFASKHIAAGYELNADGTVVKMAALLGSGTEADPYQINSVEDLIFFRNKVDEQSQDGSTQYAGKYIKLNADIDLAGINWNPIGSMSGDHGSFKGVFDGDDHTISNLNVEQSGNGLGLFAYTTGNAVIKNLKLVNVTVKSTDNSNYVGGVVGNAYADTKIENVHVSGGVHISGRGYIGGIAGHGYVKMDNVSVVANEGGLITSTFWCAGGVLGYAGEGSTDIKNAHVEGLTITSAAGGLGAIVGLAEDNNGTQPISGSNLSAKNVEIKTYTGAYGDSYSNYALGYLYGGNPTSKLTGNLSVKNVAITTSNGVTPEVNDAVASIDGTIYFNLQSAIEAVAEGEKITVLRDVIFTTGANGSTNGISYTRGVSFTLDLKGKTITSNLGNIVLRFKIGDGNNVTGKEVTVNIQNGKIVSGANNWCAISAATADNSSNKLIMNLSNLQVEANKAGDFAVKSWAGAVINTTNVDITANYAGGFYACGGEIVLDNESSVAQKGLHTAPYMSYAFGVSSGTGKMTINGGIYSAVPAAASDAYNQGASHGSSVGGVMSSGGTLIINGGTFSNDNFGDAAPTAPRALLMADAGAVVTINGGTFNAMAKIVDPTNNTGVASKNAQVTIAGGTFSADPTDALYNLVKIAEGYMTVENNSVWNVAKAAAKIGKTLYATVQAAINAAKEGDVVEIFAGEYSAIDISNKNIRIQGAVGDNGELLTTIKGGNPAITAHGFNGTIKDIKIVDAFKVMYAEPAGNVTIDNIYVTGATYGLHLVAYSTGLTWTIQNSYMDLSWANSFGVYGNGDAAIVINGNKFESTDPYYPEYGALLVNTFLPNVTVQNNIFGANTKIMIRESVSDLSNVTISKNYHADGFENAFVEDSQKADIDSYYKAVAEDGTLQDLVNVVNSLEGEGTEASPYLIRSVDELVFFRDHVNAGKTKYNAEGVYVALGADIDLAGVNWVGIGSATAEHGFMGNFDGKGFKIKNLTITNPALDSDGYAYAGFFSVTEGTDKNNQNTIQNLTIENVTITTTGHIVAAAIAYPYYTNVKDVKVCGDIAIKGGDYTAGALAYTRRCVNASNIAVSGNEGSYITGAQVVGGVISDIQMNGGLVAEYSNFSAEGVTVSGTKNVGGISGIIATQTLNGATVKNVTLVSDDARVGIVAGCLGGTSTISKVTTENVAGATALLGATYEGNAIEAKINDTYFATVENAMASNVDGVVEIFTDVTINDADAKDYTYTKDAKVNGTLTYKRTLNNLEYNAFYLPFEVPLTQDILDNYDVAYVNDLRTYSNANGEITGWAVEIITIKDVDAVLHANHPYMIKAKNEDAKNFEVTVSDAILKKAEEVEYTCSSMYMNYVFRGNTRLYEEAELSSLGDNGAYGVRSGEWYPSSSMKPFRVMMYMVSRDGSPVKVAPNASKSIRFIVRGEEGTTDIEGVEFDTNGEELIFDLQGRRVLEPKKGGLYIINGKKVYYNK